MMERMPVELRDLRVFQAIAEEGSISRAAERLGYVQSNVTARLRRLEEELGVLLFYRNPKGVQITEKGKQFAHYADAILQMAEESVRVMQDDGKPSGQLRIGVMESVTCGNFLNLVSSYQRQYDRVSLRLETGQASELLQKLRNAELDAAFITGNLSLGHVTIDYRLKDELVLLSGKKLDGGETTFLTQKWAVSPTGCPFRARLERWYVDEGMTLSDFMEIGSLETLLGSVKAGLACTLLPKSVLTGAYKQLYVYPIPEAYRYIETGLLRRKQAFVGSAYRAFAALVREQGL